MIHDHKFLGQIFIFHSSCLLFPDIHENNMWNVLTFEQ